MTNLPPLSGAILISNPRKEPVALALSNPNDRRRINALARIAVKKGADPEALVQEWLALVASNTHAPTRVMKQKYGTSRRGESSGLYLMEEGASLPAQTEESKKAHRQAKRAVAAAFKKHGGDGYGKGYSGRALGGQGKRYLKTGKRQSKVLFGGKRAVFLKKGEKAKAGEQVFETKPTKNGDVRRYVIRSGLTSQVPRRYGKDSITDWVSERVERRAMGEWGHTFPGGDDKVFDPWFLKSPENRSRTKRRAYDSKSKSMREGQDFRLVHPGAYERAQTSRPFASNDKAVAAAQQTEEYAAANVKNEQWRERKRQLSRKRKMLDGTARSNGLALENPSFAGVTSYLTGYALPVAVSGAAAGAVHSLAAAYDVTGTVAGFAGKVPVIGEFVEDHLPYTLQGLLVGSALAAVAPMIGGAAGKYLALTGGAALVFGGGIDAFNFVTSQGLGSDADIAEVESLLDEGVSGLALSGLALDNGLALSGLALENTGALGDLAMTNGALAGDDMYGQASFADAYYCGADFSVEEGQALLNGKDSWCGAFGSPSVRMSSRPVVGASHLAGKAGHRWGWLIRLVGFERACAICALPPRKRVALIAKLRQAAIAAFQKDQAAEATDSATPIDTHLPAAGTVLSGAEGATNYLGDPALFMGA